MNVLSFEAAARRRLERRLADLSTANAELSHYAAGSAGMAEAAHAACAALLAAETLPQIVRTVTHGWPSILGIEIAALALAAQEEAFRAGPAGIQRLSARRVRAWYGAAGAAQVRGSMGDVPLFGEQGSAVRTVGIVPLRLDAPLGCGVLALGSRASLAAGPVGGTETLDFLGTALSRMIGRCLLAIH